MFDSYDNTEKTYEIIYSDKTTVELTTQELYEFFIFTDTNIGGDFSDLKKRLDSGYAVMGDHMEWDWGLGCNNYKGRITITRITPPKIPKATLQPFQSGACDHKGKYINQAGGVRFWVCPKCKKDLGDA
jgi:hypothetical protein